jgi:hypothetical protein
VVKVLLNFNNRDSNGKPNKPKVETGFYLELFVVSQPFKERLNFGIDLLSRQ